MKKKAFLIIMFISLILPAGAFAKDATKKSAEQFMNKCISLGEKFDESIIDTYSDNARILILRKYPNGASKGMEIPGIKWKALIKKTLKTAKARGDISRLKNIKITIFGNKAKIKADRYSELKCYTDHGYYVIVERDKSGKYIIIEEYLETQPQSDC